MKILKRHIGLTIIMATALVLLGLIGLQIFVSFINELNEIGSGHYGLWQTLQYVILTLPSNIYSFFPMAGLLGSLIGLGYLASNRELIVMRASGVSLMQIVWAVLRAAILLRTDKNQLELNHFTLNTFLQGSQYPKNELPLSLKGSITIDLNKQTINVEQLIAFINQIQLTGHIQGQNILTSPRFTGNFKSPQIKTGPLTFQHVQLNFQFKNNFRQ